MLHNKISIFANDVFFKSFFSIRQNDECLKKVTHANVSRKKRMSEKRDKCLKKVMVYDTCR